MKKCIHVDCDCFFAALEMRDNPALLGYPIAVGGSASARGVLSTCNYEARQFGLHSAMPTAEALRRCPQLILLPHRFAVYKEAADQIRQIFLRYTDKVEPLSLDEAFLDVSDADQCRGSATLIAAEIRATIYKEVGITASAGIAPNKFLAKVASDWHKPNGQFVICPDQVEAFVAMLPVQKIPGVGKSTMRKMQQLNIENCADLQRFSRHRLIEVFGRFGERLYDLSRGVDGRPVRLARERKSLSVERTFARDLSSWQQCSHALPHLLVKFATRFEHISEQYQVHKAFVKVKFADFTVTTMECAATQASAEVFLPLLQAAYQRKAQAVRLLGVGVALKPVTLGPQMSLAFVEDVSLPPPLSPVVPEVQC